ncbi:MAG: phosphoribosylglycinamide formyltransferase, partial [Pseudomonadota bacterium]
MSSADCRVVVLISGGGSNLQALIDQANNYQVSAVFSNKAEAFGLERAKNHNIPSHCLRLKDYPGRGAFDLALADAIDAYEPDLVVLAGYMLILSSEFVTRYHQRLLNIHPSLLPKFKGLNTYQRALEAGEHWHGSSVHFVIPELDAGPIVMQAKTPIEASDDVVSLSARVQALEHKLYPKVVG